MTFLSVIRNISLVILVLIVIFGTIYIDSRCTVLLVPPFLLLYSEAEPGWLKELPIVRNFAGMFTMAQAILGERTALAVGGLACGLLVNWALGLGYGVEKAHSGKGGESYEGHSKS